ncbi:hypothetical protein GWG54_15875 [Natronococcus sp. JC468]|uniref:HTH domain-containing protein n=1 Tax=Natronococcus sp. JC468 TaxID=1961921 RepID=UPI00143C05C7|nr:HTH domain-containing protein [Natronococcus sp. JC468]NKE37269.1 hypothetical protein [Natronococcus sp. JC468]
MSAGDLTVPTGNGALEHPLRVDCYVRPTVPTAVEDVLEAVADRLEELRDDGVVDEYRIVPWPPDGPAIDGNGSARDGLMDAFEDWAERRGYSLEPGFRRREVPPSPLRADGDSLERVRVPLVALALYEATDGDDRAGATLRGVVPHAERTDAGATRTYTVGEWLSAAERNGTAVGESPGAARDEQVPIPEGGQ